MTAKEMFLKLGYHWSEVEDVITYQLWLSDLWCQDISFNTRAKIISVVDFINVIDENGHVISKDYTASVLDRATLNAINKQCEELGWRKEND